MPPGLGIGEMVLIFLVVLLLFGARRLPEIGSSLGKGIREFKKSVNEIQTEIKSAPPERTVPRPQQPEPPQLQEGNAPQLQSGN